MKRLDMAKKASEETQKIIRDWQKYSKNGGDEVIQRSETIISELSESGELLRELTKRLKCVPVSKTESLITDVDNHLCLTITP